jgi:N-acyl-D-aspartate/D-glutamate deacylase
MGISDWKEATRKILLEDEGETGVSLGAVCEEDLQTVITYPWSALECDFAHRDRPAPKIRPSHPRGYGSFPKLLEKYVRQEKLLTIEEAVRKMTSLSTTWLGINDRGYIMEGKAADITIFDPKNVRSRASYKNPYLHPEGIEYVIINGKLVIEKGEHTGTLAGKVLEHELP